MGIRSARKGKRPAREGKRPARAGLSSVRTALAGKKSFIKKVLACVALLLLCVVPALFVNSIIGYLPALIVACMLIYLGLYSFIIRRSTSFEELSNLTSCERGSRIDFKVNISNRSPLLLSRVEPQFYISDLFGDDESIMKRVTTLAPFEDREFEFTLRFDHIGVYSAGLRNITVYDLLGLFTHTMANANRYEVSVTPRLYYLRDFRVSNELMNESQKMLTSVINDGMDYAGMRDYEMGDPMKSVHWKMSARSRKLVTKLHESYVNPTLTIIMDFHTFPYDHETMMNIYDAIIEIAFSVDQYAHDNSIDSYIVFQDRNGVKRRESIGASERYGTIVAELPRISSEKFKGVAVDYINDEIENPYAANNIVICTSCFDDRMVSLLANARNRGKTPTLFGIVPKELPEEERRNVTRPLRLLDSATTPYYILDSADDLNKIL